ncbi:MAG TPA: hypothetical protein VJ692_13505, partial [Nitrospiraceae bacterium]|nr:hypothetical protein [Nitrospiraceae bacterium]
MQLFRIAAAALALLSLGSCSRILLVKAALVEGTLVFRSSDDEVTFYPWCWNNLAVVDEGGRAVWEFEVPYGAFDDHDECGPNFPIRYGHAPPRAETMVPPQRFVIGQTYVIVGNSAGNLEGAFKFERGKTGLRLRNLSPESQTALNARDSYYAWQRAHNPTRVSPRPTEYDPFVEPPPQSIPKDPGEGPSGRDDFTWVLGPDEWWNLPSLSYRTLNAEQTMFNLWCRYTNGPFYARVPPPAGKGTPLVLTSGPHRLAVRLIGAGNAGGPSRIDAVLPWNPALFRNFAETGQLSFETALGPVEVDAV